jgi:hypothetical protein
MKKDFNRLFCYLIKYAGVDEADRAHFALQSFTLVADSVPSAVALFSMVYPGIEPYRINACEVLNEVTVFGDQQFSAQGTEIDLKRMRHGLVTVGNGLIANRKRVRTKAQRARHDEMIRAVDFAIKGLHRV